jgi:hypothetical protein
VDADLHVAMLAGADDEVFEAEQLAPLSSELAEQFREIADGELAKINRSTLVPYSAGRKPDRHEVATTDLEEVAPLRAALGSIERYGDLGLFDLDGEMAGRVDLYVVTVDAASGPIHFLRRTSAKKRLKQTNKISAIWSGRAFESLEDDPILFDTSFDAVVEGSTVYILNQRSFEQSLDFLEAARDAAEATVDAAIANLSLANRDEFLAAVTGDINMISKTRSIAERLQDPEYAERMTVENLLQASEQHPEIDIDWDYDKDGNPTLVYHPDVQRRWRILKILDDDYLQSLVTNWVYEANSKHQMR